MVPMSAMVPATAQESEAHPEKTMNFDNTVIKLEEVTVERVSIHIVHLVEIALKDFH